MAAVVSHAMRRFPTSPPDFYSSYGLRGESSHQAWPEFETSEGALARSMRYANPWLYGSVRAPSGVVLAPAFVLCVCPDYLNGTKQSSKKGPSICKKCKGTRVPISPGDFKFGTVRCYPTSPAASSTPIRAGTVRVSSSSRPSILPNGDPYDLVRKSRLNVQENGSQFRARSTSPAKARSEDRSYSVSRAIKKTNTEKNVSPLSRKSILECNINPYELISSESTLKDTSIKLVNGQRVRISPPSNDNSYEDVQVRQQAPEKIKTKPTPKLNEKESDCNRFKSILKKPTTTFSDTDSYSGRERSPSPSAKSGSHFYLPMPVSTPRKKVQFLVENRREPQNEENPVYDNVNVPQEAAEDAVEVEPKKDESKNKTCSNLRRSISERTQQDLPKVIFHDSMALRSKTPRSDSRKAFDKDFKRLDGIKLPSKLNTQSPIENLKLNQNELAENSIMKDSTILEQEADVILEELGKEDSIILSELEEGPKIVVSIQKDENPPLAPPRKRSNSKSPVQNNVSLPPIEKTDSTPNKTVVRINVAKAVHKLQIKNEFVDPDEKANVSFFTNSQRKTSIMINGDDCYSTVNVSDDVPLYQSSVVVKDTKEFNQNCLNKKSSTIYITGNFEPTSFQPDSLYEPKCMSQEIIPEETKAELIEIIKPRKERGIASISEVLEESEENLEKILNDPVEAVRRNLVPHVCGKSDVQWRHKPAFGRSEGSSNKSLIDPQLLEDSLLQLRNYSSLLDEDGCSEHSSSTQYEMMDPGSDCYTDNSNRSSVTEEELANRTKFYELLAESAVEVAESEDHHYESIKANSDPIYEEIEIPPPLPSNPPPTNLMDDVQLDKEFTTRSIFEGASKYDILSYLVDAKERGIVQEDSYTYNLPVTNNIENAKQISEPYHLSTVSDSSEDNSLILPTVLMDDKNFQKAAEVERNDSGVGSETSKSSLSKYRMKPETYIVCEDCETSLDSQVENEPLICRKCVKKRTERKEIITEIVETEEKYSRDLQIILEEFYQPMLVAGLLTPDQLSAIFLNVEELLENSQALAERLRDAVEIAIDQGDEDLLTVNIGKLFLEAAPMLHAFESYCVRQGPASLLLASLEKDKELLRIFLRVSQMENTLLRRMNLNSFLMVPVQRVTKYPLLLARLHKVTPLQHETREQLKESQNKIELHLSHMNSETKDVPSKLWRRISNNAGRRSSAEMDLVNIKLRKIAVDVLEWNHEEAKFTLEGRLLYTQPTDNNWRKGRTIKLTPINALLVTNGKTSAFNKADRQDENGLIFSKHSSIREAALLLVRDKNGRYSLLREPLYLDRCVIAADPAWQSYFEVQELLGKDTFIFKAEDDELTRTWYRQLQFHAQGLGTWRKRRNALANIMINGMGLRS